MQVEKLQVDIDQFKPTMKNVGYFDDIPLEATVVSAKLDGEFTILYHDNDSTFIVNRYGKARKNFPAVNEAREILTRSGLNKAIFKLEHYAMGPDGHPLKAWDFNHIVKSVPEQITQLRFAFFDIVALRGLKPTMSYSEKLDLLKTLFTDAEYCHVVPYIEPSSTADVVEFWDIFVEKMGYEGIIVNAGSTTQKEGKFFKKKPIQDVDVVILGINKKPKFSEQLVTSLKIGVMDEDGDFIVVGDVSSGITKALRSYFWKLTQLEVKCTVWGSDQPYMPDKVLWIKPAIVAAVKYQEKIEKTSKGNPIGKDKIRFDGTQYIKTAERTYYSLRHPRFEGVRGDKKVQFIDIPASQL